MEQKLFVERNKQFSVVCYRRMAEDCNENGGWCDSEEEAQAWVEDECWIFSGDDSIVSDVWSAGRQMVKDGQHIQHNEIEQKYRSIILEILQ